MELMHHMHCSTLYEHSKPEKQSIQEFNAGKGHLSPAQEDILVEWCLGLADMALGLTPKLIQAYAHDIILQSAPNCYVSRFSLK